MLFSAKQKGFFLELSDYGCLFARTSATAGPVIVEMLAECPLGDATAFSEVMTRLQPKRTPSGYVHAVCGAYPAKRLVRRPTIDPKKVKDPAYFNEVLRQQFRIEPDKYTIAILNSGDGSDYDLSKATQKEVMFCGLAGQEIVALQDHLLDSSVYPERLELGTVATLGALVDYLEFKKSRMPTLVLEIGADATHTYIISPGGVEAARPIPQGLDSMLPVVQKELNLKDEESAKKLFYSNTFDFTGMGPQLIKKLLKELQSSIGFYEVQTGQSVGQVICTLLPSKLTWLEGTLATALGVPVLTLDLPAWLASRQITLSDQVAAAGTHPRWLGIFALIASSHSTPHAVAAEKKD